MNDARFNKGEVLSVLADAGKSCSNRIPAYLVGGGAMAFRGEKDATKDVDLILAAPEQAEELGYALQGLGFEINIQPPIECERSSDARILTVPRGMRVDIFVGTVCGKLVFSEGMRSRSEFYADLGNLSLFVCSREDIFLLKSVTERNRDLDDMVVLYRKGIDKSTLLTECQFQSKHDDLISGRVWETFLLQKIEEMEERYGVSVPWKRELRREAELKLGCRLVLGKVKEGVDTVPRLAKALDLTEPDVRRAVGHLTREGLVLVDRNVRPNKISAVRS